MRLVKKRATSLDEEKTRQLWDLIDTSRRKDSGFYKLCKSLKTLLKKGHLGELDSLGEGERKVVINLAHSYVRTTLPTVFFKEPTVDSMPTAPIHEGKEKIWDAVLNGTLRKIGFKKEAKKAFMDALIFPEAWMKWVVNTEPDQDVLSGEADLPTGEEYMGPQAETNNKGPTEWLSKGAPCAVRVSPSQVVVDYQSVDRSPENARFIDVMYLRNLSELKADPRYDIPTIEKDKTFSGPAAMSSAKGKFDPFGSFDDAFGRDIMLAEADQLVIVHEVWVYQLVNLKLYRQVVCLLEGTDGLIVNKPIRMKTWTELMGPYVHVYPIKRMSFFLIPDDTSVSGVGVWSSLHESVNWIMTRLVNFINIERQIFEMDETQIVNPQVAKAQIKSGAARETIAVKALGAAIAPVPNHTMSREHAVLMDWAKNFIQEVSGIGENRKGGSGIRTATEASLVEQGAQVKTTEMVDAAADFLRDNVEAQARIIRHLVEDQDSTEFVFRVAGDTGNVEWLYFDSFDVNWMPEINIKVDSFRQPSQDKDLQKAMSAWQIGTQAFQLTGGAVRVDILFRNVLEAMEISEVDKILGNQEDDAIFQAVELVSMIQGQPSPVEESHNHSVHMRIIDNLLNSEQWQNIGPEAAQIILQHRAEHEQMMQQAQTASQGMPGQTSNPFDIGRGGSDNPANVARQETQQDRQTVSAMPGAAGQFDQVPGGGYG